jgi:hypothetical protein
MGLFSIVIDYWMQASNTILVNEYDTSTVQIPTIATNKLEPSGDGVLVLYDFDDDICLVVNSYGTCITFSF